MAGKNLIVTLPIGQSVRDFVILGIGKLLLDKDPDLTICYLTPSYNTEMFQNLIKDEPRMKAFRLDPPTSFGKNARYVKVRKRLKKRSVNKWLIQKEVKKYNHPAYLQKIFDELEPIAVVLTHPMATHDYSTFMAAKKNKVKVFSVVKSWDNLRKGITSPGDLISVWNDINKEEAINLNGYLEPEVEINGAVSFDPFYDDKWIGEKDEFIKSLGFDPAKPLLTFATAGVYNLEYYGRDETHLAYDIIDMLENNPKLKDVQLLIRLHPVSRLEFFLDVEKRYPQLKFSYGNYMSGTGWFTSEEDYYHQINVLKYSDVIVTPCSSWVIESAIFDTPCVSPVYSTQQPEIAAAQFDRFTLVRHFKPIVENNWVPISRSKEELETEIVDALYDVNKWAKGREDLVKNYVNFKDGKSRYRIASWIMKNL